MGRDYSPGLGGGFGEHRAIPQHDRLGFEVVKLIAEGHSNKAIASNLYISEGTEKFHVKNAFEKLGVHTRAELVRRASSSKII
jgi:DNA-binding NarL/FixJ family response regulator